MGKRRHSPDADGGLTSKAQRFSAVNLTTSEKMPCWKSDLNENKYSADLQSFSRNKACNATFERVGDIKTKSQYSDLENNIPSPQCNASFSLKSFYGSQDKLKSSKNKTLNYDNKKPVGKRVSKKVQKPILGTPGFQEKCTRKISPRNTLLDNQRHSCHERMLPVKMYVVKKENKVQNEGNRFFKHKRNQVVSAHIVRNKGFNLTFKTGKQINHRTQLKNARHLKQTLSIVKKEKNKQLNLHSTHSTILNKENISSEDESKCSSISGNLESRGGSSSADSVICCDVGTSVPSTPGMSIAGSCDVSPLSSDTTECKSKKATGKKLFSIFAPGTPNSASPKTIKRCINKTSPKLMKNKKSQDGTEQLLLDVGQRLVGTIHCHTCGMAYTPGEPTDEFTHSKFHQKVLSAIKFPGWKKERVLQEFGDGSRIIMVMANESYAKKKIVAVRQVMDEDLGFVVDDTFDNVNAKIFLYISGDKRIVGCCVAEHIKQAYRVLGETSGQSMENGRKAWCCSTNPEPAKCGINRIWVLSSDRRKKIASRLLDCVRFNFIWGFPLQPEDLAFTDPTPDGKVFTTHYTGTSSFLVYKHN